MDKVAELRSIVKDYGSFRAVDGLHLDIYKGDVFGFLGPNGAGKSTTIRMITTLLRPTSGSIHIFGMDLQTHRIQILSRMGSIVEKPDFYSHLSARKNLKLFSLISGSKITDKRIDEVLELTGLSGRGGDKVKAFSHGMKQRLGIAQALMHQPELIILDEPTTGLDPQGIVDIRKLIQHLTSERKITVFLSSHLLSEMELIATRMAVINKGKCIAQGSVDELLNNEDSVITIRCSEPDHAANVIRDKFQLPVSIYKDFIELSAPASLVPVIVKELVYKDIAIDDVSARKRLENMYLQLTQN